jgi:hypothetical protein
MSRKAELAAGRWPIWRPLAGPGPDQVERPNRKDNPLMGLMGRKAEQADRSSRSKEILRLNPLRLCKLKNFDTNSVC